MENFGKRWKEINEKRQCHKCKERDAAFTMIKCCESACNVYFHKTCVNPLWTDEQWQANGSTLICDDCANVCLVCGQYNEEEEEQRPTIVCDNCEEIFHWHCLLPEERCDEAEIGDESIEWFCPDCVEEYASDEEWAEEHVVADEDMEAEDCFTRSTCSCTVCSEMNDAVDTWAEWRPSNPVQQSIKNAIDANQGLVGSIMDDIHFKHGVPLPKM